MKILIVDDQETVRFALRDFLSGRGYEVAEATTCAEAEARFRDFHPDAALLDFRLPDGTALDLIARLRAVDANVPLAVLTGHGTIDLAVQAIKDGAEHFLTKPIELPALDVVVQRMIENRRNRQKQLAAQARAGRRVVDPFVGTSAAIRRLAERAQRVARVDSPTLIGGETGTGKGVLARWLHANGPRADEPFVDLNCGGLSREFLETELFGHEKGAFTGAGAAKPGLLEIADRGTVFLDEIGDVDTEVQPKLLKVLEDKRFRRLGSVRDHVVDIRLVSATHRDLSPGNPGTTFRSDLYFRIATVPLVVPALRERAEDIPILARQLLYDVGQELGRTDAALAPDAIASLQTYRWPGNIRELRNVLERALLLSDRDVLTREELQFETHATISTSEETSLLLADAERRHIARVLEIEGGHVGRAATQLGIPRELALSKSEAVRAPAV